MTNQFQHDLTVEKIQTYRLLLLFLAMKSTRGLNFFDENSA